MIHRQFAVMLAYQAGSMIKQNFVLRMKKFWKTDHSPLTATDLTINQLVLKKDCTVLP